MLGERPLRRSESSRSRAWPAVLQISPLPNEVPASSECVQSLHTCYCLLLPCTGTVVRARLCRPCPRALSVGRSVDQLNLRVRLASRRPPLRSPLRPLERARMSYRQSYQSYTPPHRAQDRASYGQAQGPRSPPPRPSVGGEAQHARYSSADLYALHHAPPATATYSDARPSLEAGYGHSARGSSNSEIPGAQRYPSSPGAYDSDEDDDDSPGFASHGDLASVAQRRSQQYPQQQPQQRLYSYQPPVEQSHRMRPIAPPLLS